MRVRWEDGMDPLRQEQRTAHALAILLAGQVVRHS
jgi:hypothetical protein